MQNMIQGHQLSMAAEDYLEAIYRIRCEQGGNGSVRSVDVSEKLGVSKASVNKALNGLREQGFVNQASYGQIQLTEAGAIYAADVWRCHRMIRSFLQDDLGVDPQVADDEACLMEHALSHNTMIKWMAYLEKQGHVLEDE